MMDPLFSRLERYAQDATPKPALIGTRGSYSYKELWQSLLEKEQFLTRNAVRVVGLQLSNGPEWILWDLAALKTQITCVPIPAFFSETQIGHLQEATGIEWMITDKGIRRTGKSANQMIPSGCAKITFTSGTTGSPKGVCLSQHGLEQTAQSIVVAIGADYAERHLSVMPLAILLENVAGVYASLLAGAAIHIPDATDIGMANPFQPDFSRLLQYISTYKITSLILVPELLRQLILLAHQNPDAVASLRFVAVGGSKVSPKLITAARAVGLPVYEGYGLSECGSVVALNTPAAHQEESVGKVLPHIILTIQSGEIMVKNPAFLGYLGMGQRGTEPYPTGDLGEITSDGYLKISGRKKNIIITSQGRNISPEWVESHFLSLPGIAQIMVYGDAQPTLSALIVPVSPQIDVMEQVREANTGLPAYAQIHDVQIVNPFTVQDGLLTATGRPRRDRITKLYQSIMMKEKDDELLRDVS